MSFNKPKIVTSSQNKSKSSMKAFIEQQTSLLKSKDNNSQQNAVKLNPRASLNENSGFNKSNKPILINKAEIDSKISKKPEINFKFNDTNKSIDMKMNESFNKSTSEWKDKEKVTPFNNLIKFPEKSKEVVPIRTDIMNSINKLNEKVKIFFNFQENTKFKKISGNFKTSTDKTNEPYKLPQNNEYKAQILNIKKEQINYNDDGQEDEDYAYDVMTINELGR